MTLRKIALAAALVFTMHASLDAQYFGRNKVQYEQFDFKVLTTRALRHLLLPRRGSRGAARGADGRALVYAAVAAAPARAERAAAADPLRGAPALPADQRARRARSAKAPAASPKSLKRRIILPFAGGLAETDHVLGHELVHAFQYDIGGADRPAGPSAPARRLQALPLWFIEGMAEYLSLGPVDANTAMWVRDAVGARADADHRQARRSRLLPLPLRPRVLGLRRRDAGAIAPSATCCGPPVRDGDIEARIASRARRRQETVHRDWHEATRARLCRRHRDHAQPADVRPAADHRARPAAAT